MNEAKEGLIKAVEKSVDIDPIIQAFQELALESVGAKLFTLTKVEADKKQVRRIYSNMPEAYKVSGTKPMVEDRWSDYVLKENNIFTANTIEDIAKVFPDYELIASLGCESVLNLPIIVNGTALGTVNFLHEAHYYTDEHIAKANLLKLPALNCFLIEKYLCPIKEDENG